MEERVFSAPEVQAVLQHFVCVRLDGRESDENRDLKVEYGPVVLGNVQNRIVSPDGENLAALPVHFDAARLAEWLAGWLELFESSPDVDAPTTLPYFATVRQALNVAACDARLLAIVAADDGADVRRCETLAAAIAGDTALRGRFHFAAAHLDDPTLDVIGLDEPATPGVYIVAPHEFGMRGRVVASAHAGGDATDLVRAATAALDEFDAGFEPRTLVEKFTRHVELGEEPWVYV